MKRSIHQKITAWLILAAVLATSVDFSAFAADGSSVHAVNGRIFEDANQNGTWDEGESTDASAENNADVSGGDTDESSEGSDTVTDGVQETENREETGSKEDGSASETPVYAVSGLVYDDADGDGEKDEDEAGISGIEVTAYKADTAEEVGSAVTDENGSYRIEGLAAGFYDIELWLDSETLAPYDLAMTMDSDERLTGIYDEEGCILTYVSLEVNADTALELGMKSGQEMAEIEAQTRTVPETKASPAGSVTVQKVQLSLKNGGAVYNELFMQGGNSLGIGPYGYTIIVTDEKREFNYQIKKKGTGDDYVSAEIAVNVMSKAEGGALVMAQPAMINTDSAVNLELLSDPLLTDEQGYDIYIQEYSTSTGYQMLESFKAFEFYPENEGLEKFQNIDEHISVSLSGDTFEITLENPPIPAEVTLKKVDESTGEPLAGAVLEVTTSNGVTERITTTGDEAGDKVTLPYAASYTVTEIEAPAGYKLLDEPQTFNISSFIEKEDEEGNLYYEKELILENTRDYGLFLHKTDAFANKADAKFHVIANSDYTEYTASWDVETVNGTADLTPVLEELKERYPNYTFSTGDSGRDLSWTMTQAGLTKLSGAVGGKVIITFNTRINETAEMGTAIENQAKLDYTNQAGEQYIPRSPKPEVHTGGVRIKKVDKENPATVLEGAEFKIYTSEADAKAGTNAVQKNGADYVATSGADGFAVFTGLEYGANGQSATEGSSEYWIVETKAPTKDGEQYNRLKDPVKVTVNATSHSDENAVEIRNSKDGFELPFTGGIGRIIFIAAGAVLIGAGILVMRRGGKKEKN